MHYLFQELGGTFSVSEWYDEGQPLPYYRSYKKAVKIPYLFKHERINNSFFCDNDTPYYSMKMLILSLIMLENFPEYEHEDLLGMVLYNKEMDEVHSFVRNFF